jgi:RHS repeat-associated protein
VLGDSLHSYAWDAEGRPGTIDTVGITYDALGRMAEQNRSGTYAQLVYAPTGNKLALMSGQTLQKAFVPLPGGATAVYNSSGLAYYRHPDWLGSSRLASTPTRGIYFDTAYGPFGEPYAQSGTTDLSFTGQNQDTVSALYDFPFREYGIQGRWPSPDPAGLAAVNPGDPQSWNRYAYVRNSPLTLVDPLGLENCRDNPDDCKARQHALNFDAVLAYWLALTQSGDLFSLVCGGCDEFDILTLALTPTAYVDTSPNCLKYGDCGKGDPVYGNIWLLNFLGDGGNSSGTNNGMPQTQTPQQASRLKVCAETYYGVGTAATRLGTLLAALPLPKSWFGLPAALGSGSTTTIPSVLSLGSGTAASGSNLLRMGGRIAGPVAVASAIIDASAIAACTSERPLPNFLYTIGKYDPF